MITVRRTWQRRSRISATLWCFAVALAAILIRVIPT